MTQRQDKSQQQGEEGCAAITLVLNGFDRTWQPLILITILTLTLETLTLITTLTLDSILISTLTLAQP